MSENEKSRARQEYDRTLKFLLGDGAAGYLDGIIKD